VNIGNSEDNHCVKSVFVVNAERLTSSATLKGHRRRHVTSSSLENFRMSVFGDSLSTFSAICIKTEIKKLKMRGTA